MRDCERCGGEVSWTDDTVDLAGGVPATLCNPCQREFNTIFFESKEFFESGLVQAEASHYLSLAHAQQPVMRILWEEHFQRAGECNKALAALSRRFLDAKVAVPIA